MKYGNKKINGIIPLAILIASVGMSFCSYLLLVEIADQPRSPHTLTKEERKAISEK